MTRFEHELTTLKRRVVDMGELARTMVGESWLGVVQPDPDRLAFVLANEPKLDQYQVDIDREAVRLIAIYAPVARDLRCLLMIARITSELERMGDQAVDNCEYASLLSDGAPPDGDILTLAQCVTGMVRDALQAFEDEDPKKAQEVMSVDDRVDALYSQAFRNLLEHAPADAAGRTRSTGLILLARSLERIADHATNVCEEVFYLVEGADIRHQTIAGGPTVD
jgi:phosphate transport system protein